MNIGTQKTNNNSKLIDIIDNKNDGINDFCICCRYRNPNCECRDEYCACCTQCTVHKCDCDVNSSCACCNQCKKCCDCEFDQDGNFCNDCDNDDCTQCYIHCYCGSNIYRCRIERGDV